MAYLEILIAAVAAFLLGFGWYTALFGKMWQAESGVTDEEAKSGLALTHGLAFVMMFILGITINFIIGMRTPEEQTFLHGAFHGANLATMVGLPAVAINYLYQKKSLKLFAIDGGYLITFCALMGGILAALNL